VKISTELELQNNAAVLCSQLPEDLKKHFFQQCSQQIDLLLKQSDVDPAELEADFESWRKNRRNAKI
jgi:hypothetical protein